MPYEFPFILPILHYTSKNTRVYLHKKYFWLILKFHSLYYLYLEGRLSWLDLNKKNTSRRRDSY